MENWFAFRAYNCRARYGFGTEDEANRYAEKLNIGREINVYGACALTDEEAAELGLEKDTEAFGLEDELREIDD